MKSNKAAPTQTILAILCDMQATEEKKQGKYVRIRICLFCFLYFYNLTEVRVGYA